MKKKGLDLNSRKSSLLYKVFSVNINQTSENIKIVIKSMRFYKHLGKDMTEKIRSILQWFKHYLKIEIKFITNSWIRKKYIFRWKGEMQNLSEEFKNFCCKR